MVQNERGPRAKLGWSLPSERTVEVVFDFNLDLDGQMLALRPHRSDLVRDAATDPGTSP
jgi:hypothetical protein